MKRNANKGEMDENVKHLVFGMCVAFVLLCAFVGVSVALASASTWHVDDDLADYPDANFTKIQDAVDAASPGDTIIVYPGTYTENVDINKDHLTIKSENGADSTIVQAVNPNDHVFEVTADYVNITGFTVIGATGRYPSGIYLNSANHCSISNNNVSDNFYGIYLKNNSNNNIIASNSASNNWVGVILGYASNNAISSNDLNTNVKSGIWLSYSSSNTIINNDVRSNSYNGISLYYSGNNTLKENTISDHTENFNVYGYYDLFYLVQNIDASNKVDGKPIYYLVNQQNLQIPKDAGYVGIVNCKSIIVRDLILTNNRHGVLLAFTNDSRIENVTASDNSIGFELTYSHNNTLTYNVASKNTYAGIYSYYSDKNIISNNNLINNTIQAYDNTGTNSWDNGYPSGGNYWSDYNGSDIFSGSYQNITGSDGIGDTPYNIPGGAGAQDRYPFMNKNGWLCPYTKTDVGVTSNITLANPSDLVPYLPPEYAGMDMSDAVVLNVNVTDNTPDNLTDDAYTDITIKVCELDIETCKVFKTGIGFLPEVEDVTTRPTVSGEPAFSRDLVNETVTVRLYVGDPLLGVIPPAAPSVFDTGEGTYPSIMGTHKGEIKPSC
ncbi:hypothetical protein CW714_05405, partial [Methanophagales archaeon]